MRLNMWLIANRLENYSIEYQIDPNAEPILNGVLPVYMPDCVQLRQEGSSVVCYHEQGYIRIMDIGVSECYMLLQSIFNWYQTRVGDMTNAMRDGDYARFAQEVSSLFGNPVLVQDSNYRLLGIAESNVAPPDRYGWVNINAHYERPAEWEYNVTHGQASVEGYTLMARLLQNALGVYPGHVREFEGEPGSAMPYGGLHAAIRYHEQEYAKITVLNVNRKMNVGDIRLMKYISLNFSVYCAAGAEAPSQRMDAQFLKQLLLCEPLPQEHLIYFDHLIFGNKEGKTLLFVLEYTDQEKARDQNMLYLLKHSMEKRYPRLICCFFHDALVYLLHAPSPTDLARNCFAHLRLEGYSGQIRAGVSLPFEGLENITTFYAQAHYAMQRADKNQPANFYDVATEYLTLNSMSRECIFACEPNVREMWFREPGKRDYLKTLQVYLEYERAATLAANQLFIHKNTLNYRIKYLLERFGWNLDDPHIRNYLRLSMYILSRLAP